MTTWNYTATSVADMVAAFPAKTITRINGKPTLHSLLGAFKVLCRCSQKLPSALGPRGYLFIALPIDHYQRFTNCPLNLPGPTLELPQFTENMDATQREREKLQWQSHKCKNNNIKNMNESLLNMFLDVIDPAYKRHLNNDFVGVINGSFGNVFNGSLTKYGKFKPLDLEANTVLMKRRYEADDPIEALFSQINDAQEFRIFAGYPLTDKDLVLNAEVLILSTNQFSSEYKDWRSLDEADRTWEFFKEWWQEAYNLREETETTATSLGYGSNVQPKK